MVRTFTLAAAAGLAIAQYPGADGNMNGAYNVASGANQKTGFNTDYANHGYEYFDIWSPEIATVYGQNMWHNLGNNPLPPNIVERFKGKAIAIVVCYCRCYRYRCCYCCCCCCCCVYCLAVYSSSLFSAFLSQGYEQDQVMVTPTGKPGVNPEKDVSVPINWAYVSYCY